MPQLKLISPTSNPMAIVYGINISTPYSTDQINECTRKANVTLTDFNSNCNSYLLSLQMSLALVVRIQNS